MRLSEVVSMRRLIAPLFALIAIALMIAVPCSADSSMSLTEDEIAFLRDHPVIRMGVDPGFVPFEFIDRDGKYRASQQTTSR